MSIRFFAQRRARHRGFTLIELVVVIVILGILAAFAIPRFINVAQNGRISALNGVAGTLRNTSALIHGMALARNVTTDNPSTGLIQLEGTNIDVVNGYPAASGNGIQAAMNNTQGFTMTGPAGKPAAVTFAVNGAPTPAACSVTYTEPAGPNASATVGTPVTTGC